MVAEVGEVIVVRYLVVVEAEGQAVAEILLMARAPGIARGVGDLVVGQLFGVDAAVVIGFQIAEFAGQHIAVLVVEVRRDGGVEVGGDVPVVRHRQLGARRAGLEGGRQQARLAVAVQREVQPRRVQDGHAVELHPGVVRHAYAAGVVEVGAGGPQIPGVVSRIAGGHPAAVDLVLILALEVHLAAVAAHGDGFGGLAAGRFGRRRVLPRHRKHRIHAGAGVVVDVVVEGAAVDHVAAARHVEAVAGLDAVFGLVVVQPVGFHLLIVAGDHHIALGMQDHVHFAVKLVGGDYGLALLFGRGGQRDRRVVVGAGGLGVQGKGGGDSQGQRSQFLSVHAQSHIVGASGRYRIAQFYISTTTKRHAKTGTAQEMAGAAISWC